MAVLKTEPYIESDISRKAIQFLKERLERFMPDGPTFHNFRYAEEIAEVAYDLAVQYEIPDDEKEPLMLAAWFYVSGVTRDRKNFLKESIQIAGEYLKEQGYPEEKLQEVLEILEGPVKEINDASLFQQILHDAVLSYRGRKRFFRKAELLRIERENLLGKNYNDLEWDRILYKFLTSCTYYTDAARERFEKRRVQNIQDQRKNIHKAHKVVVREKTGKDFGRGVDTLYRSTYRNHINLSAIADGKANMMISINTIILSIIVTFSGAGFTFSGDYILEHMRYTIPIMILLLGALVSVVFAILSARPDITSIEEDENILDDKSVSMLYFGNFLKVPKLKFVRHLSKLKRDQEDIYDSMSVDLYDLGGVLSKKYRLLTWSYNSFMVGLVACVLSFFIIFIVTQN